MSLWSTDPNHNPAQTFLVLLRTVTPIDHFLLIFLRLQRIDLTVVAMKQQITRLQRRVINCRKADYPYNFKELSGGTQNSRRLTLGKLLTRFRERHHPLEEPGLPL